MHGDDVQSTTAAHSLHEALAAAEPRDRRELVQAYAFEQIVRVLGLDPSERLDPLQGLTEIGMDSLMAVELSNRLGVGTGLALPSTLAFEHPTLRELTDHLFGELGLDQPVATSGSTEADVARAQMEELAGISDDEAADLLLQELEGTGY